MRKSTPPDQPGLFDIQPSPQTPPLNRRLRGRGSLSRPSRERKEKEPPAPWLPGETAADRKFRLFHERHPEVLTELIRLCHQWRERGRDRWGVGGAFEVLRWQRRIAGLPDAVEDFKLNNNYRSRYARIILETPGLEDMFEIRELKS